MVNEESTNILKITGGVPQLSVLDPVFFTIVYDIVPTHIDARGILFADDAALRFMTTPYIWLDKQWFVSFHGVLLVNQLASDLLLLKRQN